MLINKGFFQKLLLCALVLILCGVSTAAEKKSAIKDEYLQRLVAMATAKILDQAHLRQIKADETLSSKIYDSYFKSLDPAKVYFTQQDINEFAQYRRQMFNMMSSGDLKIVFEIYQRYMMRLEQYRSFVEDELKKGIAFDGSESYQVDRKDLNYCKDDAELETLWRKRLKNDLLYYRLMQKVMEEKAGDPQVREKMQKLWFKKSPADKVRSRLHDLHNAMSQNDSMDILGIFLSAAAQVYGPHSYYSTPKQVEDMDIQFSLSLSGIGATLTNEDGYVKVVNIVPGGPADKDGRLKVEDRIIAVAQDDKEPVDIVDMSVSNAVKLIRGPAGSKVTLTVLPGAQGASAMPIDITIIRGKVELQEEAAKGTVKVVTAPDGSKKRIGVITLDSFYMDFEGASRGQKDYRSCSRDVRKILAQFNAEKIDALVFDMRKNSGGSLLEAIKLSGLFITSGPIVQLVDYRKRHDVNSDYDEDICYTGPMIVLTSKFSASSTEIFAGAMKDYRRALIVGDSRTYGKGTVLDVTNVGSIMGGFLEMLNVKGGKLTYEFAMFYRVNGSSQQEKGVAADIRLPSFTEVMEAGECYNENFLPWNAIAALKLTGKNLSGYTLLDQAVADKLAQSSSERRSKSPEWARWVKDIERFKQIRDRKSVSLNEKQRLKEYYDEKAAEDQLEKIAGADDDKKKANDKDILLEESLNIAAEYAYILQK